MVKFEGVPRADLFETETQLVSITDFIDHQEASVIWGILQEGFQELNQRSYDKQDMSFGEFTSDMESADVLKFLVRNREDERIEGCMAIHVGLERLTWVDTSRIQEEQDAVDPKAPPYYVTTLVVSKDLRGTETAKRLLQGAMLHFKRTNAQLGEESVCFFDCAEANYPWLGVFVDRSFHPDSSFNGVDVQVKELFTEHWVKKQSGEIIKSLVPANLEHGEEAVDNQHFYSVKIAESTAS